MRRNVLLGTAWVVLCLSLLCAQPSFWPFATFLCAYRWLIFTDEGYESRLIVAELRKYLQ